MICFYLLSYNANPAYPVLCHAPRTPAIGRKRLHDVVLVRTRPARDDGSPDGCVLERSNHVLVLLASERSLILQPAPVVGHTTNLLTVVIGDGVVDRRGGRVCSVALDVRIKVFLLLHGLSVCIDGSRQRLVHTTSVSAQQRPGRTTMFHHNGLTCANSLAIELFQTLKKALPKNGPKSQPTAPTAINDPPITNIGSSPVSCTPISSISYSAIRGVAMAMLPRPARMEATRFT